MINREETGRRLRALRGVRTRTGAAGEIGCSVSALRAYEEGLRVPRDEMKIAIANYYGVSVSSIWYPEQ